MVFLWQNVMGHCVYFSASLRADLALLLSFSWDTVGIHWWHLPSSLLEIFSQFRSDLLTRSSKAHFCHCQLEGTGWRFCATVVNWIIPCWKRVLRRQSRRSEPASPVCISVRKYWFCCVNKNSVYFYIPQDSVALVNMVLRIKTFTKLELVLSVQRVCGNRWCYCSLCTPTFWETGSVVGDTNTANAKSYFS